MRELTILMRDKNQKKLNYNMVEYINSIGRRKTSVARAYMKAGGKGQITINDKKFEKYFVSKLLQLIVKQPHDLIGISNDFDFKIKVFGGGLKGQAEAIRLAIARAFVKNDPECKPTLKKQGLLTRDPRMVERKKYGRRKARRAFQWASHKKVES